MMHFADSLPPPPEIRNQQVADSNSAAGSIHSHTISRADSISWTLESDSALRSRHIWFSWQGAYRGAYRWLSRLFGLSPVARIPRLTDDLDTAQRTANLTKRLRG